MRLDYLREFTVYAQYLNLTNAAEKLHISQPNLSKHLKQLEAAVGFDLLDRSGPKTTLTPTGEVFLERINSVLESYDQIIADCLVLDEQPSITINAMQHYYNDEGSKRYYSCLFEYQSSHPLVNFHYGNPYREDSITRLRAGDVDIVITYACGPLAIPKCQAKKLADVPLAVWCSRESPLAMRATCTLSDLGDYRIIKPNDANIPFYSALETLFRKRGIAPRYRTVGTSNQTEFYSIKAAANEVLIMPLAMGTDQRISIQGERAIVPLDASLSEFAVFRDEPLCGIDLAEVFDNCIDAEQQSD